MDDKLSDHVRDYKLETLRIKTHKVVHVYSDPNAPPSSERNQECWSNEKRIGYGGQGQVFLQTCGSRQRAVKKIPLEDGSRKQRYIRELETIIKFSHDKYSKHFVKSLGWYKSRDSLYIAMEYFPRGDLETYLIGNSANPTLPEDDACQITSQVLQGLAIMHKEGFAHRDIKPKNVLIQQHPTPTEPSSWWVKLTDFGISKRLGAPARGASTVIGTPDYMAPELFSQDSPLDINSLAADMWALGVMTLFILTFQSSRHAAFQYARNPDGPFPRGSLDHVNPDGQAFIRALIRLKPDERLDSNAAVRHAWVQPWMLSALTPLGTCSDSSTSSSGRSSLDEEIGMETRPTAITGLPRSFRAGPSTQLPLPVIPRERPSEAFRDYISIPRAEAPSSQQPMCDKVSGSDDNTAKIWDPATGAYVQTLQGHSRSVNSVAFSADGHRLVSGSGDETIKIWDIVIGVCVQTLKGHTDQVTSVVFSADSQRLISGSGDRTVKIWDAATGTCLHTLKGHSDWVTSVAFSVNNQYLASGSGDKMIKIWNIATGVCVQTLEGHYDSVNSVAFSPDSQRLASGGGMIKIWDAAIGACVQSLWSSDGSASSIAFSPDSQHLASGGGMVVKIWDAAIGSCVQTLKGHSHWVASVAFSADGQYIASGSLDKLINIWDVATGVCMQTLKGHGDRVTSVAFSADSQRLASGSGDRTVKIWDIATGVCVQTLEGYGG